MIRVQYILIFILAVSPIVLRAQDLLSGGSNSWLFHTPDDGRTNLFIVPGANGTNWNWDDTVVFYNNGNLDLKGSLSLYPMDAVAEGGELFLRGAASFPTWVVDSFTNRLRFHVGSGELFTITSAGAIGIGTAAPGAKLHVQGSGLVQLNPDDGALEIASGNDNYSFIDFRGSSNLAADYRGRLGYSDGYGFGFAVNGNGSSVLVVLESGNVGIGTTNPTQKLSVNGTIRAKEVIVDSGWADHVFTPAHRLAPLAEVEQHIAEHGRLPGMPSAEQVATDGIAVSDAQRLLLEKVEELTLHLLAQQKRIQVLEATVEKLQAPH